MTERYQLTMVKLSTFAIAPSEEFRFIYWRFLRSRRKKRNVLKNVLRKLDRQITLVLLLFLCIAIFRLFLLFGFITLLIDCSGWLTRCAVARRLKLINSRHFTRWLALAEGSLVVAASCKKAIQRERGRCKENVRQLIKRHSLPFSLLPFLHFFWMVRV